MSFIPLREFVQTGIAALDAVSLQFQIFEFGIGDPHFPRVVSVSMCKKVPDSPRVICPTCSQVVTPISGAADVPR